LQAKPVGVQHGESSHEPNFSRINRPIVSILFLLDETSENPIKNLNGLNFESKHVIIPRKVRYEDSKDRRVSGDWKDQFGIYMATEFHKRFSIFCHVC
jgi:hypothetical protein